ncbi:MAG: HIT family protein [Patescibacteria group bacterium]
MECLFCKIIAKQIPSEVIYENDASVAVLDAAPRAPGHTMVLPKVHAESILDLPDTVVEPVFAAVKKVTAILQKALAPDGFTIGINQGRAAGQAIDHLHIHVIPRWGSDNGGSIHSIVTNIPKETPGEIRSKIIKSMS